jgi:hypothetical protein
MRARRRLGGEQHAMRLARRPARHELPPLLSRSRSPPPEQTQRQGERDDGPAAEDEELSMHS